MSRCLLAIACHLILLPLTLSVSVLHEVCKYIADVTLRLKLRTEEFFWWLEGGPP